jgi:hypothetical protein
MGAALQLFEMVQHMDINSMLYEIQHTCTITALTVAVLLAACHMQLAEMVQHLEISAVVGMACATYKSHPHLLQFFAPHAAIGESGSSCAKTLKTLAAAADELCQLPEVSMFEAATCVSCM